VDTASNVAHTVSDKFNEAKDAVEQKVSDIQKNLFGA
jgi:hypothetical protein